MSSRRLAVRAPSRGASPANRNLPLLLLQARESVMAHFRPLLKGVGITEQQWRVLRALLERGPMEPRDIGDICRISSPSLAGVLARMDELGLVSRKGVAHDQRRVLVSPTAKSRGLARRLAPQIEATYASIRTCVGAEFIERFHASLDELIAALAMMAKQGEDAPRRPRQ